MFWPDFGEERISGGSLISLWAVAGIGGSVRVPAHQNWSWWRGQGAAPTYFASYFPAGLPPPLILEPASGEWLTGRWGRPECATLIRVVIVPVIPCA